MRSTHHGGVISEFGGIVGETKSLVRRVDASTRNHDFIRSDSGQRGLQNVPTFLIGEKDGFASRSLNDNASDGRARVALGIRFNFLVINFAVGIKRRGNGWENSRQKHVSSSLCSGSHLTSYSSLFVFIPRGTCSRQ